MVDTELEKFIKIKYNNLVNRFDPTRLKKFQFLGDDKEIIKRKKILNDSIRLYAEAKSLKKLCNLNVQLFNGKIYSIGNPSGPFHDPMYPKGTWDEIENVDNINITDQLININKLGIYTYNSQNGKKGIYKGIGYNYRMFVTGITTDNIAKKLYNYFSDDEDTIVIKLNFFIIQNLIKADIELPYISITTDYEYNPITNKKTYIGNLLPMSIDDNDWNFTFNKIMKKDSEKYSLISIVDMKYNRNTLFSKIIDGLKS